MIFHNITHPTFSKFYDIINLNFSLSSHQVSPKESPADAPETKTARKET